MRRFDAQLRTLTLWDEAGCLFFNRGVDIRWICRLFRAVSRLGDGVFWYVLMAALLVLGGMQALRPVLHMVAVGVVSLALYKWLKTRTLRPRPFQVKSAIRRGADPLDPFSFPSGHTLHAVSFSVVAIAYFPSLAVLLVPFTMLAAASRVVLGLHYPSDVLAGAGIGALLASGSFLLV